MIQGNGSELGNYVSNFATPGQEGFSGPFPLMRWLWSESTLKGLRKCHRVRYGPSVEVFAGADGEVFFVGYCRCHGVWCCPLCAPMIRRGRARELSSFLVIWNASGGGVLFSTFTLPHSQGDRLAPLFRGVSESWHDVLIDRGVRSFVVDLGLQWVRSLEVTHGENGWHPHAHSAAVVSRPLSRDEAIELRALMFRAWCSAVVRRGWRAPDERYGVSLIRCSSGDGVGDYMSKVEGLADELTRLDSKKGRRTDPPFVILRRAAGGDADSVRLWHEYESGTFGHKALTYSRGFSVLATEWGSAKRLLELSDAELCEPDVSLGLSDLGVLSASEADMLALHPHGFEKFRWALEACGGVTPEACRFAMEVVRGTMPWFLSEAGWAAEAGRLRREKEQASVELLGVQAGFEGMEAM